MKQLPVSKSPEQRIRVLITGPDLQTSVGGVQTHINLFLSAFDQNSHVDIRFFRTSLGLYKSESNRNKVLRFLRTAIPFVKAAKHCDVVHLNSSFGTNPILRDWLYGIIATYIARKPVILQFHGGLAADVPLFRSNVVRSLFRKTLCRFSRILILSKPQRRSFQDLFHNVPNTIVPNFVDIPSSPRDPKDLSLVRFLFMARISKDKGIREIIEASEALQQAGFDFEVLFYGDGPDAEWLERKLDSLDGNSKMKFRGRVDGNEKVAAFESSHALLLPSTHREGFPYGILEAFSYNMPAVATDVGAIAEIIEPGVNGFILYEPITKNLIKSMQYFLEKPTEIQRMGINARKKALQKYSLQALQRSFCELYRLAARE